MKLREYFVPLTLAEDYNHSDLGLANNWLPAH
jgi:hypothetical protein